jgi:uncharacterized protein (DUF4415 family)
VNNSSKKVSARTRRLYEKRDKALDNVEPRQLPPEVWANAEIGKFYRPLKTAVSLRIDADVLAWLKSKGEGHLTRINSILRRQMEKERRAS